MTCDNRDTRDGGGHRVYADASTVREQLGFGRIDVLPGAVLCLLAVHQLRELHEDRPRSEEGSDRTLPHREQQPQ